MSFKDGWHEGQLEQKNAEGNNIIRSYGDGSSFLLCFLGFFIILKIFKFGLYFGNFDIIREILDCWNCGLASAASVREMLLAKLLDNKSTASFA